MTLDTHSVLRKSLDDITRLQKRQFATGIVGLFSLLICFFGFGHVNEVIRSIYKN